MNWKMWWDHQNFDKPRRDNSGKRWNFRAGHESWSEDKSFFAQRVFFWDDMRDFCAVVLLLPGKALHVRDLRSLTWRVRIIVERSSNTVVGSINLKGPPTEGDVEIGWGLDAYARGKGYATEASAAVIHWVAQHPGATSISATVPDENHASQRVAAQLGLCRTTETRRDLPLLEACAWMIADESESRSKSRGHWSANA